MKSLCKLSVIFTRIFIFSNLMDSLIPCLKRYFSKVKKTASIHFSKRGRGRDRHILYGPILVYIASVVHMYIQLSAEREDCILLRYCIFWNYLSSRDTVKLKYNYTYN